LRTASLHKRTTTFTATTSDLLTAAPKFTRPAAKRLGGGKSIAGTRRRYLLAAPDRAQQQTRLPPLLLSTLIT